jgi:serine protease Do
VEKTARQPGFEKHGLATVFGRIFSTLRRVSMKSKAIGALALLLTASMPALALEGADIYSQVRPSLVQLVGVGAEGRFYLGSGVALPNGSIVTNCHVTQHAKRVEPFWGNSSVRAESQRADVQHDLCLVRIPGLPVRPAEVATSKGLHVGDKVFAVGFNGGRRLTYEEGEVSELYPLDGGMVIRTTAAFSQGASGGGLFDEQGRLVGILTFFRVSGEVAYFAVPIEWVKGVEGATSAAVQPMEGTPFWAASIDQQPQFLQAGALEADGRWQELATLARGWIESDPQNVNAWETLAKASAKMGDQATAETALKRIAANRTP